MESTSAADISRVNLLNINIRTLDSQVYLLRVYRLMSVLELKHHVATATGVLIEHQRLLYRGRVLRDDQSLAACNIQDGHSVHLVTNQPDPSSSGLFANHPAVPATVYSEGVSSQNFQAAGPSDDYAFNIQGYGYTQTVTQAISWLFQGLGLGETVNDQASQYHTDSLQWMFWLLHVLPDGPDAMTTMFQSLNRMMQVYRAGTMIPPTPQPVDPTIDALATLMMRTMPLLSNAMEHLCIISRMLEGQSHATSSTHRHSIQTDAWQFGTQLQDIGAFILELGRVTTTIQLSRSTPEAVVGSGPAWYITHLGPNRELIQNHDPQDGTSSGRPSSSSAPPHISEGEDPNIGRSNRRGGDKSTSSPRSKRLRRE